MFCTRPVRPFGKTSALAGLTEPEFAPAEFFFLLLQRKKSRVRKFILTLAYISL